MKSSKDVNKLVSRPLFSVSVPPTVLGLGLGLIKYRSRSRAFLINSLNVMTSDFIRCFLW